MHTLVYVGGGPTTHKYHSSEFEFLGNICKCITQEYKIPLGDLGIHSAGPVQVPWLIEA